MQAKVIDDRSSKSTASSDITQDTSMVGDDNGAPGMQDTSTVGGDYDAPGKGCA